MRHFAFLALFALTACSSSTAPSRALPTGVFTYATSTGLTGTLTISASTDEGVTGTWDVRLNTGAVAFQPALVNIGWNMDAFVVFAQPQSSFLGTHSHRLARQGDGIRCSGTHVGVGAFTCTLTRR